MTDSNHSISSSNLVAKSSKLTVSSAFNVGMPEDERLFHKILREACDELNIHFKKLSYDWVIELTKDDKIRHIISANFDINSQASALIARDKFATYSVLKSHNIPIIEHTMLFNPDSRSAYVPEEGNDNVIQAMLDTYKKLVVKPNDGCKGKNVSLCSTWKEVNNAVQNIFQHGNPDLVICPYYDIKVEYRTFYLNGEIFLIYGKTRPFVIGNGIDSLEKLVNDLNLPHNAIVEENLEKIDLTEVPGNGEKVYLSWKHNLSGGATAKILKKEEQPELYSKIENLALKTGKAMNLKFVSVDIIQTQDDAIHVLEVNSSIGTSVFARTIDGGYEMIKEMFQKALSIMFEN